MAFFRSVATVGLFTLLSRFLGFVRDLVTAMVFGAGPVADAFVVAQRLPNTFRSFFAEGAMDSAFIPIYARKLRQEGDGPAAHFAADIFVLLAAALTPFTLLALVFMPQIVSLLVPGFVSDKARFDLAVTYSGITFGYLVLVSVTALLGGILNAKRRFAPSAMAPVILNAVMIIGLFGAAVLKLDVGMIGSWSLIVGGVAQLLVLTYYCRKEGVKISLARPKFTKDVKQFFKLVGPGVIGTGAGQISGVISTILASSLSAGSIAALYYADRLLAVPVGVIGLAIGTALLPVLTHHIAAKEQDAAVHHFSRATEFGLALSLPIVVTLMMEAAPIVRILFQYGAFNAEDTRITAESLIGYGLTVPAVMFIRILTTCFFACEDSRTPIIGGFVGIVVNLALSALLMIYWKHIGIAVAFTLSQWVNALCLLVPLLRRGFFHFDHKALHRLPRLAFAGAVMALALAVGDFIRPEDIASLIPSPFMQKALLLCLRMLFGTVVYAAAVHFTGAMRYNDVMKMLKKKAVTTDTLGAP